MAKRIVVLSGPVSSGKSTLAKELVRKYRFIRIQTRELIAKMVPAQLERRALQQAGEDLDRKTGGRWVGDALAREIPRLAEDAEVLVDSVRIENQIDAIREAFGSRVVHVHLTAPVEVLADRYAHRSGSIKEVASYEELRASATEKKIEELAGGADIVIDTNRTLPQDVVIRVASHLGLYGRSVDRLVDVLVGGQFGSEGKGNVCSYVARE